MNIFTDEHPLTPAQEAEMEARHNSLSTVDHEAEFKPFRPMKRSQMRSQFPELKPIVINGICRRGEIVNVIAASKVGKSWLAYELAYSVVTGDKFLGTFRTKPGRVLLIDNELDPETLNGRMQKVEEDKEISPGEFDDLLETLCFRGEDENLDSIQMYFGQIDKGQYDLIILDAWYRFIPQGVNESSNADITRLYNKLVRYAKALDSAILIIHHSSKGDQGDKAVTDVGSGAGAMSRAADSHLVIRQHAQEGLSVLEGVCRSFPPMQPVSMYFEFPCWRVSLEEPVVRRRISSAEGKEAADQKAIATIKNEFKDQDFTVGMIRTELGCGQDRANRICRVGMESKAWKKSGMRESKNGRGEPQQTYQVIH